jgi:hypothetical protein
MPTALSWPAWNWAMRLNWAAFNPEFPLPGEGKTLTLSDLSNDPEGKQIAKGFMQYLKVVAAY